MIEIQEEFVVIHPMFSTSPKQSVAAQELGRMPMSKTVRVSLLLLRCYLILLFMLLGFHMLDQAGVFKHHA